MNVLITDFALKEIKSIHRYYSKKASENIADKLTNKIFDAIEFLEYTPKSGSREPLLRQLNFNHRYIIVGNYKIIFKTTDDLLYVTDIFDTRQNPRKILRRNK